LRASVGSTEASNGRLARVGVLGPKQVIDTPTTDESCWFLPDNPG
jgi:hypothetical protein